MISDKEVRFHQSLPTIGSTQQPLGLLIRAMDYKIIVTPQRALFPCDSGSWNRLHSPALDEGLGTDVSQVLLHASTIRILVEQVHIAVTSAHDPLKQGELR